MELFNKIILAIHIIAGVSTLITGPIAIFYNFKDPKKHRIVGKAFFYAMLIVGFFSINGWVKDPHSAFMQFLMGIAIIVVTGVFRGVRAIFIMKGGPVIPFDFVYTAILGIGGIWMAGMSVWHFQQGTMVAIPILFAVFAFMALNDTRRNISLFRRPSQYHRLDWMRLHSSTMLGAFTASTTAFTVNAAHFLPWWAQWFGPTMLLLPLQFYFGRKLLNMARQARAKEANMKPSAR